MNQILNILRKDLRRFWREIAVSMALLGTYSWNDVREWSGERDAAAYGGSNVGNMGGVEAAAIPWHGFAYSIAIEMPPLAVIWFAVP